MLNIMCQLNVIFFIKILLEKDEEKRPYLRDIMLNETMNEWLNKDCNSKLKPYEKKPLQVFMNLRINIIGFA